jgi:prevent-host-death family protein
MIATANAPSKIVGAYEAKSKFSELLDLVESGRTVTITRHSRNVARLVPAGEPVTDRSIFNRIRSLHAKLSLPKGVSARDLINDGRRI